MLQRTHHHTLTLALLCMFLYACGVDDTLAPTDEINSISQGVIIGVTCDVGGGKYCYGNGVSGWGGSYGILYTCSGKGRVPTAEEYCTGGCQMMPAGTNDYCLGAPVYIRSGDRLIFNNGNYDANNMLRWYGTVDKFGGGSLGADHKDMIGTGISALVQVADLKGDFPGQCVSMVKALADRAVPETAKWQQGGKVMAGGVTPGTAVATFTSGKYFNDGAHHVGFFEKYEAGGFVIYEQNGRSLALKLQVGKRTLSSTSANNFYVLLAP